MLSRIKEISVFVAACAALLLALGTVASSALADVEWRSGAVSVPTEMQPGEMAQALSSLSARPEHRRVVMHFDGPLALSQRAALTRNRAMSKLAPACPLAQ